MGSEHLATDPKKGLCCGSLIGFLDESGVSDRPSIRRTWSRRGVTPIIRSAGGWRTRSLIGTITCTPRGNRPRLFLAIRPCAVRTPDAIRFLTHLRQHLGDRTLILIWDNLKVHRSRRVQAFLRTQRDWLTVRRFPSYAPDLNPVEYVWSTLDGKDLANTCPDALADLDRRVRNGARRLRRHPDVLTGCLRASGLFKRTSV